LSILEQYSTSSWWTILPYYNRQILLSCPAILIVAYHTHSKHSQIADSPHAIHS